MNPDDTNPVVAQPRPWLFALAYALHLADEYFAPPSLAPWGTEHFNIYFTKSMWLAVNISSLILFLTTVWLVARRTWPSWVLVTLAVHMSLHALMHGLASAWAASASPGLSSSLLLILPLAAWTLLWARGTLDKRVLLGSGILGIATFQPPLDFLVRLAFGLRWSAA